MSEWTFKKISELLSWKQGYIGLLVGMGRQAVCRLETGERKETLSHKEMLSLIAFIDEKNLLDEYVTWRFQSRVSRHYYKKSTPMANQKYPITKNRKTERQNL